MKEHKNKKRPHAGVILKVFGAPGVFRKKRHFCTKMHKNTQKCTFLQKSVFWGHFGDILGTFRTQYLKFRRVAFLSAGMCTFTETCECIILDTFRGFSDTLLSQKYPDPEGAHFRIQDRSVKSSFGTHPFAVFKCVKKCIFTPI